VLFEGADGSNHTRSVPLDKVMDDVLLVYAQNGEMLRPEQGYPLRAFIPGWEGNVSVKWLRRIKVADQPWHFRSKTARYTDPMPDGKWRQFSFVTECKSVITRPSGDMKLERPGFQEIQGFAWSGRGRVTAVDVSVDGGKNWQTATLEEPVLDPHAIPLSVDLGRAAGGHRQPRCRLDRLRAADGAGHHEGARHRRVRPASQWRLPVVGERERGGAQCDRVIVSSRPSSRSASPPAPPTRRRRERRIVRRSASVIRSATPTSCPGTSTSARPMALACRPAEAA
jgi:sulfane dehydrogenase subunit SoxC